MWNRSEDSANETQWWILLSDALTMLIVVTDNTFTHTWACLWLCRACKTSTHCGGPVKEAVWQAAIYYIYVISLGCLYYITVFNLIVKQISWNEVEFTSLFNCRIFFILDVQRSFDRTMRGCPWWNINFHNSREFRELRTKYKSIQIKRHTNVITKIDPHRVKVSRRATHLYLCLTKGGGKWHWREKKKSLSAWALWVKS